MTKFNLHSTFPIFLLAAWALIAPCPNSLAGIVVNGGFESGLSGWTTADQLGSDGTFSIQSGLLSPVLGDLVPAPPGGLNAAMSDAGGPGSHVLYQDIFIPNTVGQFTLSFSLFVGNRGPFFATANPATIGLDFSTPSQNQQARVDIVRVTANPFTVALADVLQNLYQTKVGDPLISGYNSFNIDVSAVLAANAGQTVRLRFAEVDNLGPFQLGVDNVDISPVPEPSSWLVCVGGLLGLMICRGRK